MADGSDALTLATLDKSGAPSGAVRSIKQWAEANLASDSSGYQSAIAKAKLHGSAFAEGVRSSGEGAIFGAILGGVHGALPQGLDIPIPGTKVHLPLDGAGALLGILAGTFAAAEPHGVGRTLSNGGATCAAIYSFRKMNDLVLALKAKKAAGVTPGGGAAISTPAGTIGKATFTGEGGYANGSAPPRGGFGTDPVIRSAVGL